MSVRHLEDFVASLCMAAFIAAAILPLEMGAAQAQRVRAQDAASLLGAERAQGVVIWSHGRSLPFRVIAAAAYANADHRNHIPVADLGYAGVPAGFPDGSDSAAQA